MQQLFMSLAGVPEAAIIYYFCTCQMLDIKDWTDALKGGLPPVKLPKYVFGTAGCYSFMEEKLRPILEYEDLKTGVFQVCAHLFCFIKWS